jgi:hypothetical protein
MISCLQEIPCADGGLPLQVPVDETGGGGRQAEAAAPEYRLEGPNGAGHFVLVDLSTNVKNVLDKVGDDDPAALLVWDIDHVIEAVLHLNSHAGAGAVLPPWLGGSPYPITSAAFMQCIVNRVGAVGGGVIGNALIAPNTYQQYAKVQTLMYAIGQDPVVSTLPPNVLPLARNFSMGDKKAKTTGEPDPVLAPPPPGVAAIQ